MISQLVAAAAAAAAVSGAPTATPGVTATTITIGGTVPLNGPASAFGSVGRGADAYFRYVNSKGGVFGRRIVYKFLDDEYEVPQTIQLTRQLVEQDHVFAIFNTVGTDNALAIRSYLNEQKVPGLFAGSGVSRLATDHRKYPWTMGYLPSFVGEGVIYGRRIAATKPKAKIAVLFENSDFGKDLLNGLRRAEPGDLHHVRGRRDRAHVNLRVPAEPGRADVPEDRELRRGEEHQRVGAGALQPRQL